MACSKYGVGDEYRIVLIGKTGAGKSASANSLLGKTVFKTAFGAQSVTQICAKAEGSYKGRKVVLVDTPGLFDTVKSQSSVKDEIMKCIAITSPGPHAVVLVVQAGRISPEEQDTVKNFIRYFGDQIYNYLIILFTKYDQMESEGVSLDEYIKQVSGDLKEVLSRTQNRYLAIDNPNQTGKKQTQVDNFFSTVGQIVKANGNMYYSNAMYEAVEAAIQERFKAAEKEKQRERQRLESEYHEMFMSMQLEQMRLDTFSVMRALFREDTRLGRSGTYVLIRTALYDYVYHI